MVDFKHIFFFQSCIYYSWTCRYDEWARDNRSQSERCSNKRFYKLRFRVNETWRMVSNSNYFVVIFIILSDNIVDIFCKYMNYNRFIKLHIYWLIGEPFSHFTQFLFKLFFFTIVDTFCNRVQMFIELINTIRCDWTCHTLSILFNLLKLANSML